MLLLLLLLLLLFTPRSGAILNLETKVNLNSTRNVKIWKSLSSSIGKSIRSPKLSQLGEKLKFIDVGVGVDVDVPVGLKIILRQLPVYHELAIQHGMIQTIVYRWGGAAAKGSNALHYLRESLCQ